MPRWPTTHPSATTGCHEVKFDGYRILAVIEGKRAKLISRNGLDWTARFHFIAGELARLKVKTALLDGEVVAVNAKGVTDFGALPDALSTGSTAGLVYYVFDLLHLDGYDLRGCALEERKRVLEARVHPPASTSVSITAVEDRRSSGALAPWRWRGSYRSGDPRPMRRVVREAG